MQCLNEGRRIGNSVINLLTIFHKNACNGRVLRFSKWRKWHTKAAHRYRRFLFAQKMKQDYKGFTVPEKIWRSESLDINSKFVACCLIDYFERSGIKAKDRLPEYECKITVEEVNDIIDRANISLQIFFLGLNNLGEHGFVTKLIVSIDATIIIKTHF